MLRLAAIEGIYTPRVSRPRKRTHRCCNLSHSIGNRFEEARRVAHDSAESDGRTERASEEAAAHGPQSKAAAEPRSINIAPYLDIVARYARCPSCIETQSEEVASPSPPQAVPVQQPMVVDSVGQAGYEIYDSDDSAEDADFCMSEDDDSSDSDDDDGPEADDDFLYDDAHELKNLLEEAGDELQDCT
jgi:hypothetical protein